MQNDTPFIDISPFFQEISDLYPGGRIPAHHGEKREGMLQLGECKRRWREGELAKTHRPRGG
jgi:hypothetical protein